MRQGLPTVATVHQNTAALPRCMQVVTTTDVFRLLAPASLQHDRHQKWLRDEGIDINRSIILKWNFKEQVGSVLWINLAQDRDLW